MCLVIEHDSNSLGAIISCTIFSGRSKIQSPTILFHGWSRSGRRWSKRSVLSLFIFCQMMQSCTIACASLFKIWHEKKFPNVFIIASILWGLVKGGPWLPIKILDRICVVTHGRPCVKVNLFKECIGHAFALQTINHKSCKTLHLESITPSFGQALHWTHWTSPKLVALWVKYLPAHSLCHPHL